MHSDQQRLRGAVLAAILLLGASLPAEARSEDPASQPMQEDASLHDVAFVDPDLGWAVGDRGVIWQTHDGGRHWQLQRSPVTCSLRSIYFVDPQNGWIVGGWTHPFSHKSSGVVLRTRDGGRQWQLVPKTQLPKLLRIRFHDARHGWALGHASPLFPNGVFRTEDGGRSWAAVPGGVVSGAMTADFRNGKSGVVAGRDGKIVLVADAQLKPGATPSLGWRHLRQVRLLGQTGGWLVGDGGLLMTTADGGHSWQHPASRPDPELLGEFDFRALAVQDGHCWVAGAPGSRILHSADGGNSWNVYATDQTLPLRALYFLDSQRGWAVGDLGTILATRDGGRTWQRQREGGTRAALLGLISESERTPWELLAGVSGDEGYLSAIEVLGRRDVEVASTAEVPLDERAHEAAVAIGGCSSDGSWRFPLRQPGLRWSADSLLRGLNFANDGRAIARLEAHAVRKIRQWRPEVIVTDAASPDGSDPLGHLANQIVVSAVQKAADPTAYPEQFRLAGLGPWSVKKVYSLREDERGSTVTLNTSQLAVRLGASLAEHAEQGRGLVETEFQTSPTTVGFQLIVNRLPQDAVGRSIFSGLALQPGGEARRRLSAAPTALLGQLQRMSQKRRNVQQLLEHSLGDPQSGTAWLSQVEDLTSGLRSESSGDILFQLAQRYRLQSQPRLAAEALEMLVRRYPEHRLSGSALIWLVQYYASGEQAWQMRKGTRFAIGTSTYLPQAAETTQPRALPPRTSSGKHAAAGAGLDLKGRSEKAIELAGIVEARDPALYAEPALRFALAAAHRQQGTPREAERFYHSLAGRIAESSWTRCARGELWLLHGDNLPPTPTYRCPSVGEKPYLDGKLDDVIWQSATPLALKSQLHDDAEWPAAVKMCRDDEYLYLAVSCRKAPAASYPTTDEPRPRDPDLQAHDRVDFLFDVDRDYATFYRLTVDHRGWTGEACAGDSSWNPAWFVAAEQDEESWTVEVAIPWSELGPSAPGPGASWAFGVQRSIPNQGFQSWTHPASTQARTDGFGLLMFAR